MLLDFSTFHGCSLLLTDAQHFRYYNYITQRASTSINFTLHFRYFTDTWTHCTPKSLFLFISFCKIHVFYNEYIFSVNFRENAFFSVRSVQRLENKGFYGMHTDTSAWHHWHFDSKIPIFIYIYFENTHFFYNVYFFFLNFRQNAFFAVKVSKGIYKKWL